MKQMVVFQMVEVPCDARLRISSYGVIFDDSGGFWNTQVLDLEDFLENDSNDFDNFVYLDETNGALSIGRGPMFWKTLDLELWSDL